MQFFSIQTLILHILDLIPHIEKIFINFQTEICFIWNLSFRSNSTIFKKKLEFDQKGYRSISHAWKTSVLRAGNRKFLSFYKKNIIKKSISGNIKHTKNNLFWNFRTFPKIEMEKILDYPRALTVNWKSCENPTNQLIQKFRFHKDRHSFSLINIL